MGKSFRGVSLVEWCLGVTIIGFAVLFVVQSFGKSAGYSAYMSGCLVASAHLTSEIPSALVGGGTETSTGGVINIDPAIICHWEAEDAGFGGVAPEPTPRFNVADEPEPLPD